MAGFLLLVLVSVSRDFELGRNISCEDLTVSPIRGYFCSVDLVLYVFIS